MVRVDRYNGNEQYTAARPTLDRFLELREEHDLELPESFWMERAANMCRVGGRGMIPA